MKKSHLIILITMFAALTALLRFTQINANVVQDPSLLTSIPSFAIGAITIGIAAVLLLIMADHHN